MPESGNVGLIGGIWAFVTAGITGWVYRLNQRMDSKVGQAEFKMYIEGQTRLAKEVADGQERLNKVHEDNVKAQTESVLRAHERIDKLG